MTDLHVPPLTTDNLAAVGGRIGSAPEHFRVEELPLYEASGEGEHWYVFVEKRSATTPQLIQAVARAAGVRPADIGSAGMKDKHAVTRQWLSVPGQARPPEAWHLPEFARLLSVSRHKNKLRTGHLRANRFHITLVDVPDGGLQRARDVLTALQDGGLPNYFGPQRFGKAGSSFAQAFEWMRQSQERSPSGGRPRRGGRFETKFLSSVIQSDLFNRYLTARLERREPLLTGEVVRLAGTSRLFVVEDVQQELPRLQQGDIHRTGPILGPRTVQAAGEAAALEASLIEQLGLSEADREVLAGAAPGARRDLLITPEELAVVSPEPGQLVVSFVLPAGSYATQLIRELTRSPWFEIR